MWRKQKNDNSKFSIKLIVLAMRKLSAFFNATGSINNNEQSNFFQTKSISKGLPLISKEASGCFGQVVWYEIEGDIPGLEKFHLDTHNKSFA